MGGGEKMVFVNLKKPAAPVAPARRGGIAQPDKKCMSCGTVLDPSASGIDARRFCSTGCKSAYMTGTK